MYREVASGLIEGIGEAESTLHFEYHEQTDLSQQHIANHHAAFTALFTALKTAEILDISSDLLAIGHRVVHGGEHFTRPTLITVKVLEALSSLNRLAPLHNPANLLGIETCLTLAPEIPNVAIFDTAFHSTLPPAAFLYALDKKFYKEAQVRRYGFHGTSHHYVAQKAAEFLQRPLNTLNLITLHLGNGASACAIEAGESVDTSMGFTPLEGLVMGTRSGDLDPAIVTYLMRHQELSGNEVETLLNKQSGLKGLCGDNDMRHIIRRADDGDTEAQTALELFCYRLKKYIGAYTAVLGEVDAIVFTGGIGEHAPLVRAKALEGLDETLGIALDLQRNTGNDKTAVHLPTSRTKILVIPTNEELQIAQETDKFLTEISKY